MNQYLHIAIFIVHFMVISAARFPDWLVTNITTPTTLNKTQSGSLLLGNGIISREFVTDPDFATIDYYSYEKQSSLLRAIGPEAVISLDGAVYNVGGLLTLPPRGYLNRTLLAEKMAADPQAFRYVSHSTSTPTAPYPYKPNRGAPSDITWPPKGLCLTVLFKAPSGAPSQHQNVKVNVTYEMYDGIPLLVKWVNISNTLTSAKVNASFLSVEYLNLNYQWAESGYGWMFVETDQPHGTQVTWGTDPSASGMPGSFQPTLNCSYTTPFNITLTQRPMESFRVHQMAVGSSDPERQGLARRRKVRLLAPQTQENPIYFHMTNGTPNAIYQVLDEMAEVGFEMLVYSFGAGFDIESQNETYIQEMADIIKYANNKGIEVGGYDLIVWNRHEETHPEWEALGGSGMCIASGWYEWLLGKFESFIDKTGLSMVVTDGPYPGYNCSSMNHSHHTGLADSTYWQNVYQGRFYRRLRERGVYINQPDKYFYWGGNKDKMAYSEHQFSLPRWQDLSVSRQLVFDDTFNYIPTMGWMFMPLVVYEGGGDAAKFEPLSVHALEYEWGLAQYLGAGVAATYHGYRPYDGDKTKDIVKKWISFYKKYRDIVTSDIIHVRRPDMQSIDCYMHVNPKLTTRGLAMMFNPTHGEISMNLTLPLYYTGLNDTAQIGEQAQHFTTYKLDNFFEVDILVHLPPLGITWFLIK